MTESNKKEDQEVMDEEFKFDIGSGADCGNCKFWQSHQNEFGTCRRNVPAMTQVPVEEISDFDIWPKTFIDWWCGEWERHPDPEKI